MCRVFFFNLQLLRLATFLLERRAVEPPELKEHEGILPLVRCVHKLIIMLTLSSVVAKSNNWFSTSSIHWLCLSMHLVWRRGLIHSYSVLEFYSMH
jgi:hypothetical protein